MKSDIKWIPLLIITAISVGLWQLTPPEGLSVPAWHTVIIFVATIAAIVCKVGEIGLLGIVSMTIYALTYAAGAKNDAGAIKDALSQLSSSLIWLVVVAFMIARGFIKTGLGRRIALLMIRAFGKKTLGLAYGLAFADLILAPAMPSNTARCGGVIYPIADSLSRNFESYPENESRSKVGTFLVSCIGNMNDITSALFLTAYTGNLLVAKLATDLGYDFSWGSWMLAMLLPCVVSFIVIPLVIYFVTKPEIKNTPDAPALAVKQLAEMGKVKAGEWVMIFTVIVLLILWIFGQQLGVNATTTAFVGLSILLLSGVLSWDDIKNEKGAWDTLIWFAALLMMATQLQTLGFTKWFGELMGQEIGTFLGDTNWIILLVVINAAYFYLHYFFASGNAQIAALYSVLLGVGLSLNVPLAPLALSMAASSSLSCSLTQYTHARGPILFGAGYVPTGVWWKTGFIVSVVNQIILFGVGLIWWKMLGLY
nr:DASS family sodium-coupled anion symporter [uncultured Haemophilus sp.]